MQTANDNGFLTGQMKEKLAFINSIESSPAMPPVVLPLLTALNDPDTSIKKIERLIEMDRELVTYLLRLTNSPLFRLHEKVYAVPRAIILIGMSNVRSLVTSYSMRVFCKAITQKDMREFLWNHSLSVAVLAKILAEKVYGRKQPDAYIFSFLHDIGKVVLFMHHQEKFQDSFESGLIRGLDFVSSEESIFGFSHVEAGYFLAERLGFSREMKNIVLFHHDPAYGPTEDKMPWVISLANELSHHIYDNKAIALEAYLPPLNISNEELVRIIPLAQKQVEQFQTIL